MRDSYPSYPGLPDAYLVPPELQPEYLEMPGRTLAADANVGDLLADAHVRAGHGADIAVIHHESGRTVTFDGLATASTRLAAALSALGVDSGDRVAFRSTNRPEILVVALAAWKLGAVVVPTPIQAREAEVRFFLEDTTPRVLFALAGATLADVGGAVEGTSVEHVIVFGDGAEESGHRTIDQLIDAAPAGFACPSVSSDSVALVWHTGGTTGKPKGCYHTQRRFLLGGYAVGASTGVQRGERWAAAAPMGHALGFIYHTIYTLLHGATVVLIEGFGRADVVLDAIAAHQVDTFTAIAATWARMLDVLTSRQGDDVSSLHRAYAMWQSASSSEVHDGWKDRGVELMNNFGSTAFATWILVPRQDDDFPLASLGRPSPGYVVEVVEPDSPVVTVLAPGSLGRMAVRGPTGLTYWNRPQLQARDVVDGWNLVDDLIQFDESGNAAYLGRTDFLISSAGYKIAPVEVETVLARHPAVREVGVIGTPDPIRQEIVSAFVVVADGHEGDSVLVKELQELVKAELSPYKYPRRIEFIDALPRDDVGKVQPRILKDRYATEEVKS
jgi:2-aminobenzoate-CoA ligase